MLEILKDIASGALPVSELPGFIAWMLKKLFWVFFALIVGGVLAIIFR